MITATQNQIQLANIDEELTRLWDQEQGQNKIRASLFDLVLYLQKNKRLSHYQNLIKFVISKFPCRVITIIVDEDKSQKYLKTKVSSETISQGELQIFCEIIQIEVAGNLIERVPFLILPLLLPDLPIYLLWTQDPTIESAVLSHLEPIANRIIFDSESTKDLQQYSLVVSSLTQSFHSDISDLNWSALAGWRALFTSYFDTANSFLSLTQSNFIRIYYNKISSQYHQHAEIKAAYFQAWLASRLNWKFRATDVSEGNVRLTYQKEAGEVVVMLVPQEESHLNPGTLLLIEIESRKDKGFFAFKRHPQTRQVFIQYSDTNRCDLPYCTTLAGMPEGEEIIKEIFYPSIGEHYFAMLEVLSKIPWKNT